MITTDKIKEALIQRARYDYPQRDIHTIESWNELLNITMPVAVEVKVKNSKNESFIVRLKDDVQSIVLQNI